MFADFKGKANHLIRNKQTQIPTLPAVIHNILHLAGDDRISAKDLADFIGKDQAIAGRVLRLANSAYYCRVREVETISRAVMVVGFSQVMSLAIGMTVFSTFQQSGAGSSLDMRRLWLHSIACHFACRQIVARLDRDLFAGGLGSQGQPFEMPVYLSGLLHDLGKVIYAMHFPEELRVVLETADASGEPLDAVERELLGMDHADLAGQLMERWNFPESVTLPARYHHNPEACTPDQATAAAVVSLADYIVQKAQIGGSGNASAPYPQTSVCLLKLKDCDIPALIADLKKDLPKIQNFISFVQ